MNGKITNDDFNDLRMIDYYNFRRLREAELINPRPTSTTSSYKRQSKVDNLKRHTQHNPDPSRSDMMAPLRNDTKKIFSVDTEKKIVSST